MTRRAEDPEFVLMDPDPGQATETTGPDPEIFQDHKYKIPDPEIASPNLNWIRIQTSARDGSPRLVLS